MFAVFDLHFGMAGENEVHREEAQDHFQLLQVDWLAVEEEFGVFVCHALSFGPPLLAKSISDSAGVSKNSAMVWPFGVSKSRTRSASVRLLGLSPLPNLGGMEN